MNEKERFSALEVALNNEMREELEHYERLKQLHEKWEKQGKWPETVPLKVKDTVVKDILVGLLKQVEEMPGGDDDDLEAVRTAIDFEAKGAKLYAELRDAVSDPKEKEFFDLLARIENEHYLSLKDTEEYFTDPASWYRKVEHHTFDGAP
jgi:rubrerythrin